MKGLLNLSGINVLDVDGNSVPLELYIQNRKKERKKTEAVDDYFKSIIKIMPTITKRAKCHHTPKANGVLRTTHYSQDEINNYKKEWEKKEMIKRIEVLKSMITLSTADKWFTIMDIVRETDVSRGSVSSMLSVFYNDDKDSILIRKKKMSDSRMSYYKLTEHACGHSGEELNKKFNTLHREETFKVKRRKFKDSQDEEETPKTSQIIIDGINEYGDKDGKSLFSIPEPYLDTLSKIGEEMMEKSKGGKKLKIEVDVKVRFGFIKDDD